MLDDPETLIPQEDVEPDKSEDDWLSSLEKVSLDDKDTWPSLIESEKRPVTNSGSLKIDDTEELDWLSDLVEKEEPSERPNWEEITGSLPPLPKDKADEEAESLEDLFSKVEEETEEAEEQALKMTRKAAKADAKAETAARDAESSGVLPEEDKEEK